MWISWDDDFVAYHRPSGKTHFLNAASNFLIAGHLVEPRTTDEVALAFRSPAAAGGHGDTLPDVVPLLERLEHLGLIDSL